MVTSPCGQRMNRQSAFSCLPASVQPATYRRWRQPTARTPWVQTFQRPAETSAARTAKTVTAHFQQNRGQHDRAGSWCFDVGVRQPGVKRPHRHFHRERRKERQPQPGLHFSRKILARQYFGNIRGAGVEYMAMIASNISTEPSRVYKKNLKLA